MGGRTATFVLGDIVSSTRQWLDAPDRMRAATTRMESLVSDLATAHDGELAAEQGEGDSFVVAFARATDAVMFAWTLQRSLGSDDDDVRVRVSVHSGDADFADGRWRGSTLNRAGRLRDLAHGGQVILSAATAALVVDHLPDGMTLRDLGRHRLRDLARPEEVRQLCHPDLPDEFAPLASVDRYPNNLPVELTSFIGRDTELQAIAELLDRARLVTLTGAGGAGKTRLALHVAARHLDLMADGVWLADLSSTADPAMVPNALGAACSLPASALQSMTDTIVNHFGDGTALVVLDNCEHLLDACADLAARMLAACPSVSIVATSREPLGIDGETVYRVPALALPSNDDDVACESVQLFVERARAVRDSFVLDNATRAAALELCRRLDGLPLAIELAASRCRAMSPVEIAAQLSDRFRILTAGRRASLPRQRALDASVQWSYDLLDDDERALLRRLAVFAGGFTVDGAEVVGVSESVDHWKIVDLLTGLVDKSLVHLEDAAGSTRYGLLETIRIFAAQRLDEAGELDATRARYLAHMVAVAEDLSPRHSQGAFGDTVAAFLADIENFRSALDGAIETSNGEAAVRILAALGILFGSHSTIESTRLVAAIVPISAGDPMTRALAVFEGSANGTFAAGDIDCAERAAVALERLHRETSHPSIEPMAAYFRAQLMLVAGDAEGLDRLRAVADRFVELGEDWLLFYTYDELCQNLVMAGRIREARRVVEEASDLEARCDNPFMKDFGMIAAGLVASVEGRFDDADRTWLRFGAASTGWAPFISSISEPLIALSQSAAGDHAEACERSDRALERARRCALPSSTAVAGYLRHWLWYRAGRSLDENELSDAAEAMDAIGAPWGHVIIETVRADARLLRGDVDGAVACSSAAVALARSSTFGRHGHPRACRAAARALLARGDVEDAEALAHEALAIYVEMFHGWGVAEAVETLAHVLSIREQHVDAARLLGGADHVRRAVGWAVAVPEQPELLALSERVTNELGSDAYEAAFNEGVALTEDELVAFAQRGRGSRKRPSHGWSSLTPTEREVVKLLGEGLRNREIAQKLFMAEATVRTHLSHVFAKLGMSGRGEVIAAIRESGFSG